MTATGTRPAARSARIASATAPGHEPPVRRRSAASARCRTRSRASRRHARSSSAPRSSSRSSPSTREPRGARARDRPLTRRRECGHVGYGAPARERAGRGGEAEELRDPAHRLIFHLRRGRRPDGEVRVEARGEQIADDADLEAGRRDEGEVPRARLGDRLIERAAGVLEHLEHVGRPVGQGGLEQLLEAIVDWRLDLARMVEAPPAAEHDVGGALERLLTGDVEAKAHGGRIGATGAPGRPGRARRFRPLSRPRARPPRGTTRDSRRSRRRTATA